MEFNFGQKPFKHPPGEDFVAFNAATDIHQVVSPNFGAQGPSLHECDILLITYNIEISRYVWFNRLSIRANVWSLTFAVCVKNFVWESSHFRANPFHAITGPYCSFPCVQSRKLLAVSTYSHYLDHDLHHSTKTGSSSNAEKATNTGTKAIIIEPSRELAEQTCNQVKKFKKHLKVLLFGALN